MLDQITSIAMFMPLVGYMAFTAWTYLLTESCAQNYLKDRERYERGNLKDWTITIINQGKVEELTPAKIERKRGLATELIPVEVEV